MKPDEKLKIVNKVKERTEAKILKNAGETFIFGTSEITLRELPWIEADELEDKVTELVGEVQNILKSEIDDDLAKTLLETDISGILNKFKDLILRKGLLDLAFILSRGKITIDSIKEAEATKSEVIKIVIDGLLLNYSYIKNLIPLIARGFK